MLFSIVVPVYNVEKYLIKCIESILSQNYTNFEVILVDDGSTDNCPQICDEYSYKDKRVKALHKNNGGLSDARNAGIDIAVGEYLVFVDSDDMLEPDSLSGVCEIINKKHKPDVVINRIKYYFSGGKIKECDYFFDERLLFQKNSAQIYEYCSRINGFWMAAWSFVVKKEYLISKKIFFVKGLLHEDEQWTPRIVLNSKKIAFNNNCFYRAYAGRVGSICNTKNIKRIFDKLWIIEDLLNEAQKSCYTAEAKRAIESRCSQIYVGVLRDATDYRKDIQWDKLLKNIIELKHVLNYKRDAKYKIVNLFVRLFGVKSAMYVFHKTRA